MITKVTILHQDSIIDIYMKDIMPYFTVLQYSRYHDSDLTIEYDR